MVIFNISGFLTDFAGGRNQIQIEGLPATVGEGLSRLWELHAGLRDRVVNEKGEVRLHVNIFVNHENIRHQQALDTALSEGDEITILPSVSGG